MDEQERHERILVTGGSGFIGSAVVRQLLAETEAAIINVDCLTYAANPTSLADVADHPRYRFEQVNIRDVKHVRRVFHEHQPDAVLHLAAESHVDRSIDGPGAFIQTNVVGTSTLLNAALTHWMALSAPARDRFRFVHVSTDEVFGSLNGDGELFREDSPYRPNSPYSASKAASDHLVRSWRVTYGLPTIQLNSCNTYGPRQFPEKLIPLMIIKAMAGEQLPVYGTGENVRDWLHVDDHARALRLVLARGEIGRSYNLGARSERRNIDLVRDICELLDERLPDVHVPRAQRIEFVPDRPGHDLRYAMDPGRMERELGWQPQVTLDRGLHETIDWYLANHAWWQPILDGVYGGERLGRVRATARLSTEARS